MTTFTITCPPTVAGTTRSTTETGTGGFAALYTVGEDVTLWNITGSASRTGSSGETIDSDNNTFSALEYADAVGVSFSTLDNEPSDLSPESFGDTKTEATTFSWDGARTAAKTDSDGAAQTVWTASQTTSSQTTTTQTNAVYQTTFTDTTNVTTRSGTTVQTGSMTAPEPRTTVTQTQGFTTKTTNLSTTRITTTTQQDNFNRWRTGEGGGTHRGTWQTATVVCLETSNFDALRPEIAWIVTQRPTLTATSSAVVETQDTTQFTVFPSFVPTAGHVEEATWAGDELGFTLSTSSEVIETPTTYRTTTQTATTITVASQFTALPSPLGQQAGTTISTQDWFSTIRESRFTGGDTSTTTIFSTTTHEGRIGELTWNATHRRSTTALTSFDFSTSRSQTSPPGAAWPDGFLIEFDDLTDETDVQISDIETVNGGGSTTTAITFNRPISVLAATHAPFVTQNQCASSLSFAVAAASNLTSAAQQIGAEGISVNFPVTVNAARTARAPLGSWSYVTEGTTISASAGPASLSVTSAFGPNSAITAESTEGAWTLAGAAVSRANLVGGQRINLGGVAPIATATAFYDAGAFSTSDANGSGTAEATAARTEAINATAARTAYLPATGVFISGGQRYNTTARNLTQTIEESAIITNRAQLIL